MATTTSRRFPLAVALLVAIAASLLMAPTASAATPKSFSVTRTTVPGGSTVSATVRLATAAPTGGQRVTFASSSSHATAPAALTIAAGRTSGTGRFVTRTVDRDVSVTLSATTDGVEKTLTVVLTPAKLSSLSTPSTIVAGTPKTGTVTLDAYPLAPVVVGLSSSDAGVASVPATATVPVGKKSVTFSVTTTLASRGTTTITAAAGGVTKTDVTKVDVAQLSSVSFPRTMAASAAGTGTVRLTGKAPSGGATVALGVPAGAPLDVPATVRVPEGATSQTFALHALAPATATKVTVTSTLGTVVKTSYVTVAAGAPTVGAVVALPDPVGSGSNVVIGVALTAPVRSGEVVVTLASNNQTVLPLSQTVRITAGYDAYVVVARTGTVTAATTVTISASGAGGTESTTISVKPYAVYDLTVPTGAQVGPLTTDATVQLTGPAPAGGAVISVASNDALVGVPATVTIPAGSLTASVPLTIGAATSPRTVSITVGAHGSSVSRTVTVSPIGIRSFGFYNDWVAGGNSSGYSGSLNADPPPGGVVISLVSSNPAVLAVPATFTATAAGQGWGEVTTTPVSVPTTVRVTATLNGVSVSDTIVVRPVEVYDVGLGLSPLIYDGTYTPRVRLSTSAPEGGMVVTFASSNPSLLQVQGSVVVPEGQNEAAYTLTTRRQSGAPATATVTASGNGSSKSAVVTINPVGVTFGQGWSGGVRAGVSETISFTLTGPAPAGGVTATVTYSNGNVVGPASVAIAAGESRGSFSVDPYATNVQSGTRITVSLNGFSANWTLYPTLARATFALDRTAVTSGETVTATLTYDVAAGPAGYTVPVVSSNPTLVPGRTVQVATGETTVSFTLVAPTVSTSTTLNLRTGDYWPANAPTLTINPPVSGGDVGGAEEPATERPIVEEPTTTPAQDPTVEATPTQRPTEVPVVEAPATEVPVVEEPATEAPVVEEPTATPTPEPTGEATRAPTETATPAPAQEPTATPSPETTAEPAATGDPTEDEAPG